MCSHGTRINPIYCRLLVKFLIIYSGNLHIGSQTTDLAVSALGSDLELCGF